MQIAKIAHALGEGFVGKINYFCKVLKSLLKVANQKSAGYGIACGLTGYCGSISSRDMTQKVFSLLVARLKCRRLHILFNDELGDRTRVKKGAVAVIINFPFERILCCIDDALCAAAIRKWMTMIKVNAN